MNARMALGAIDYIVNRERVGDSAIEQVAKIRAVLRRFYDQQQPEDES